MAEIDFKNVRPDFLVALWIALLVCLFGLTFLLADVERRLGKIEHYLIHNAPLEDMGDCEGWLRR